MVTVQFLEVLEKFGEEPTSEFLVPSLIGVAHTVGLCIVQINIAHCRTYINWLLTTAARRKFLTKKTWYISLQKVKRKLFKSKNSILGIKPEKYSTGISTFQGKRQCGSAVELQRNIFILALQNCYKKIKVLLKIHTASLFIQEFPVNHLEPCNLQVCNSGGYCLLCKIFWFCLLSFQQKERKIY